MSKTHNIIPFFKYQGCGNDFIMIDDRQGQWQPLMSPNLVSSLCHRHFGIGADGLILATLSPEGYYYMVYYNADGQESTFCGNGGRCFAAFIKYLKGEGQQKLTFLAKDGLHQATYETDQTITLSMQNPEIINRQEDFIYLNTGSPHVVVRKTNPMNSASVLTEGSAIRYDAQYQPGGVNANFAWIEQGEYNVRTYERGVENETLSCGTGACATAISLSIWEQKEGDLNYMLNTQGGILKVMFSKNEYLIQNVRLNGAAKLVFEGNFALNIEP